MVMLALWCFLGRQGHFFNITNILWQEEGRHEERNINDRFIILHVLNSTCSLIVTVYFYNDLVTGLTQQKSPFNVY